MDAELPDFEPSDGHRHDCPRRDAPAYAAMPQSNLAGCSCADELYALACVLSAAVATKIDDLGDVSGHVLVFRDIPPEPRLVEAILRPLGERYGENAPLVLVLASGSTVESLDEDEMRKLGWFRSPGLPVVPTPPGAYL